MDEKNETITKTVSKDICLSYAGVWTRICIDIYLHRRHRVFSRVYGRAYNSLWVHVSTAVNHLITVPMTTEHLFVARLFLESKRGLRCKCMFLSLLEIDRWHTWRGRLDVSENVKSPGGCGNSSGKWSKLAVLRKGKGRCMKGQYFS